MIVPGESTFTEVLEVSQSHLPSWATENQADFQEHTGRTYVLDFKGSREKFFVSYDVTDWFPAISDLESR
jgi:hypothetical protein